MNASTNISESTQAAERAPSTSPAQQLIGFTNNLLASSVVIVVALVVGSQLISFWRPNPSPEKEPTSLATAWPTLQDCAIHFGDRPYSLNRKQIVGDEQDAVAALTASLRNSLNLSPVLSALIGPAEKQMIEDAKSLSPIDTSPGNWRILQVINPNGKSAPMLVGLKDNCSGPESTRLVSWGIAVPNSDSTWNLFACSIGSGSHEKNTGDSNLLPSGSKRTLSIASDNGNRLLGFSGGDPEDVKRFYGRLAKSKNWLEPTWKQNGSNWECWLQQTNSADSAGIHVQFTNDNERQLRGFLVVEPNAMMGMTK